MKSTKWVELNADELSPAIHPADAIWSIESDSPYAVPSHARAIYDELKGELVIELKYFEPESVVRYQLSPYISVEIGKKSHRVRSIRFDAHGFSRDQKRMAAQAALDFRAVDIKTISNKEIAARAFSSSKPVEKVLLEALG